MREITWKRRGKRIVIYSAARGTLRGAMGFQRLERAAKHLFFHPEIGGDAPQIVGRRDAAPGQVFAELLVIDPDIPADLGDGGFVSAKIAKVFRQGRGRGWHGVVTSIALNFAYNSYGWLNCERVFSDRSCPQNQIRETRT
ncbi:hypothetical protein [Roseovarius sp.]|uniref:hypothetical protein n=1 Tax=Roseovarius sp. TaxID=1486281 RepID=UPI00257F57C0|nr:hypothetical protein [Roseovarius sp.]